MATDQQSRKPLTPWTLLVALSLSACSGSSVDGSEPGNSGSGGAGSEAGGTSSGGSGGSLDGTGGAADPNANCEAHKDESPGTPVYDLSEVGSGECEGATLGSTIERVHTEHPELSDIQTLYVPGPENGGDGSFIYAFKKPDGTFALVFKRGDGDCEAGCIENDYFYFDTVAECAISAEGQTSRPVDGCLPVDQLPKWGIPPAAPPESICGVSMDPQDLSGDYIVYFCGQGSKCSTSSKDEPLTLPGALTLHIAQDAADLAHGTVTLAGTGEPLIDGRALSATFERRRFHVEEHVSNLPAQCEESHDLTFDYDFEGFGARHLSFFQVSTPDCDANPGDYCKGFIEADLGSEVDEP